MKKAVLTLNVTEDDEFREYIKSLIRDQVKSLVRSEIMQMAREAMMEKTEKAIASVDIEETIRGLIAAKLGKDLPVYTVNNMAKDEVRAIVREKIRWSDVT